MIGSAVKTDAQKKTARQLRKWALMTLGTLLLASGVYFFKFPNNFSTGGVSGLSVILGHYFPSITPGDFVMVINVALLLIGFAVFGRSFGIRTCYCSLLMSVFIWVMERAVPLSAPMTSQPLMELIFAVGLPAVGSAILFNLDASTGGTDIAALILKKYSGTDVGRALLYNDVIIAAAALFIFGITAGLCSLLGLVLKSVLVDSVIESLNRRKAFIIITSDPRMVSGFITHDLARGATIWRAQGAYTLEEHWVVLTVLTRGQAVLLRRYLKEHDPHSFMIVTNSSEIFGKGFLRA